MEMKKIDGIEKKGTKGKKILGITERMNGQLPGQGIGHVNICFNICFLVFALHQHQNVSSLK